MFEIAKVVILLIPFQEYENKSDGTKMFRNGSVLICGLFIWLCVPLTNFR